MGLKFVSRMEVVMEGPSSVTVENVSTTVFEDRMQYLQLYSKRRRTDVGPGGLP